MKDNEPMTLGQQLSPEETQQIWQIQQKYDESIRTDLSRLPDVSDQLSKNTADLREQFVLLLKNLPPESSLFQHLPTPIPTPKHDPNSVN
jgi:hypothetical protein